MGRIFDLTDSPGHHFLFAGRLRLVGFMAGWDFGCTIAKKLTSLALQNPNPLQACPGSAPQIGQLTEIGVFSSPGSIAHFPLLRRPSPLRLRRRSDQRSGFDQYVARQNDPLPGTSVSRNLRRS
jgi:hypothetical protein